jgi:hypothetical protein
MVVPQRKSAAVLFRRAAPEDNQHDWQFSNAVGEELAHRPET